MVREELNGSRHEEILQNHVHDDVVLFHLKTRYSFQTAVSGAAQMLLLAKSFLQYQCHPRHQSRKRMHKR